jgi:hypothetical protein
MPNQQRYVPFLQGKAGELEALRLLTAYDKGAMTPLLEFPAQRPLPRKGAPTPKRPKQKCDWLSSTADAIRNSWGPMFPVFVEVRAGSKGTLPSVGISDRIRRLFHEARNRELKLIPVVRLTYGPGKRTAIRGIVAEDGRGVCIRLTRPELELVTLKTELQRLLDALALTPASADLVLDLHVVDANGYSLMEVCAKLPMLDQWRTFTVAGGAFPSGLAKYAVGVNWIPRYEWRAWSGQIFRDLPRIPGYGDYATRHPIPFDPDLHPPASANIRYTIGPDWLVLKGLQLVPKKRHPTDPSPYDQFPAMAHSLEQMKDTQGQPYFCGETYSRADGYLHLMGEKFRNGTGSGKGNTGGTTEWLSMGVSHHLTFTVIEIGKLFGSSIAPEPSSVAGPAVRLLQVGHTALPSASRLSPGTGQSVPAV